MAHPKQTHRRPLERAVALKLAARADVDPRSVEREYLAPGSVRGMAGARARGALVKAGLLTEDEARAGWERRGGHSDWMAAAVTRGPTAMQRNGKTR